VETQEDRGVGWLNYVPGVRRARDASKRLESSRARVTAGLDLEDVRAGSASPSDLVVGAGEDTLWSVDGHLGEGSSGAGEDNEESHGDGSDDDGELLVAVG